MNSLLTIMEKRLKKNLKTPSSFHKQKSQQKKQINKKLLEILLKKRKKI
jgi:hypothetical protein